jgi:hypothetical protein
MVRRRRRTPNLQGGGLTSVSLEASVQTTPMAWVLIPLGAIVVSGATIASEASMETTGELFEARASHQA